LLVATASAAASLSPLSLPAALPIFLRPGLGSDQQTAARREVSVDGGDRLVADGRGRVEDHELVAVAWDRSDLGEDQVAMREVVRSEEPTSELQSRFELVCRLLLEKK